MKTQNINPDAIYWATFNRFEIRLPGQCVLDCIHSGPCDSDVSRWAPKIREQVKADAFQRGPNPEAIRLELKEYAAWEPEELQDDDANFQRLVWIAAGNIKDDETPDCSEPVTTTKE